MADQEEANLNAGLLGEARRSGIVALIAEKGEATVAELADVFSVSSYTVRRDLDALSEEGILTRVHGGAVSASRPVRPDSEFEVRLRIHAERKNAIGALAATLVDDNTSCLINSGTTAIALTKQLGKNRDLTIVTNNIHLPSIIDPRVCRDLHLLGGSVRFVSQATVGPVVLASPYGGDSIKVSCDSAFVAVGGVDATRGFTTSSLAEAAVMRSFADAGSRVVILADRTKMGQNLFASVGPLALADVLVTDEMPPEPIREALLESGVELMVADSGAGGSDGSVPEGMDRMKD